jgi:hypothetical protein
MREKPQSSFFPPIALQKWGEGPMAGMVSEGGEVWMCAFCVGGLELLARVLRCVTKSAKDKGFSRVFMWAKVGRKELCQGGVLFCVSNERRDFEVGDRDEGGMEA